MNIANSIPSVSSSAYGIAQAGNVSSSVSDSVRESKENLKRDKVERYGSDVDRLELAMSDDRIDEDNVVTVMGTDGDDQIDISAGRDGSYEVTVNGQKTHYDAKEARRLVVKGGAGNDTITFSNAPASPDAPAAEPQPQVPDPRSWAGPGPNAPAPHYRGVLIDGGAGNDTIKVADDVTMGMYITGGHGNDTIMSGSGHDLIIDNYGSNTIDGGAGNDTIIAMGKDDSAGFLKRTGSILTGRGTLAQNIEGGLGDDEITTGDGADIITDKGGNNTIRSNGGNDTITMQAAPKNKNTVYAGKGDDVISVDNGQNAIYGEDGNDTINGGAGRDYIEGGHGHDRIFGNGGSDVIYGGRGNDYIEGGQGDDFINAGHGNDEVHGGQGNDVIFGLSGKDKLYGDEGEDTLVAGRGRDTLDGGEGFDTIRYSGGLFGSDEVQGNTSEEDVRKLNPSHVPLNLLISPKESQAFKENMRDNLEAFTAIEPGQAMLHKLGTALHPVVLASTDDNNGYCQQMMPTGNAIIRERANGDITFWRNVGSGSVVKINPSFIDFNSSDSWSEQNTMVIMAHELAHAYNNATGTMDNSIYREHSGERVRLPGNSIGDARTAYGELVGAELQAVGLHGDSILKPNPYGLTENDYRQFFHMPTRLGYTSHISTSKD